MKITKTEIYSFGKVVFYGEDLFSIDLINVPREKKMLELVSDLVNKKEIKEPERKILNQKVMSFSSPFLSKNTTLFFFKPRPRDGMGNPVKEIADLYLANSLKGDPIALSYLNILDKDSSFIKSYPHFSLFEYDKDTFYVSYHFSRTQTIEGTNINSGASRLSSYFPPDFWFCGIDKNIF